MVIAAKLYVEHPALPLSPTIRSVPEVQLGVFSDAGTDPEHDVYIFWIEAPDFEAVEHAMEADETVDDWHVIVESDGRRTCRLEYADGATLITPAIVEAGGLTVEARSYSKGWMIHLQLRDHDALFALNEYAKDNDIHLDILELHQNSSRSDLQALGLTDTQRDALVTAYVQGHYDKPRTATLEDVADTLGISLTAASGRLRRGSAQLIESVLLDEED